jgi:prepilin-type N-terminal cleavage/methylation domain-containing protein
VNAKPIITKNPKTCKYFMIIFQKTRKSAAFTLIEILVVISIMGILAVTASGFNFNKKTEIEKRDRFVSSISNLINKAKTDAMLGR